MPKTSYQDAAKIVDRIMSSGEKIKMSQGILSIAFGWETKTNENQTMDDIFKLAEEYMYRKKIIESQSVRGQTIKTIVKTLFEKSPREEGHSKRVSDLSVQIARILNLPPHIVSDIQTLGLLHDIGKIIVPSHILEKPDRLTSAEFSEIKKHPSIGYRMLTATSEFSGIAEGVLYHHERWDGQGYPEGLKGHQIPLQARIISIADAIDAMTFARPYRQKVMSDEEVREELLRCAGTQFDPEMIAKIIDSIIFPRWEKDLNQHTINKRQAEE
ncbi:MAG: HD-GYP domain-containing protein, partial [Tissierellales bacterium]|nr:HD-GYP domain-containing protein [Tissierellales bacterium]